MMKIRKTIGKDASKILEYCKVIGSETDNLTFGSGGIPITVQAEEKYLNELAESLRNIYLIAEEDDEIVGSAVCASYEKKRLAHRATISISVKRKYWGKHIGTKLMEEIMKFVRNTPTIKIISLEVRSDNSIAIHLYEKFGFKKIGTFKGYMCIDNNYVDCDIMELVLDENEASK